MDRFRLNSMLIWVTLTAVPAWAEIAVSTEIPWSTRACAAGVERVFDARVLYFSPQHVEAVGIGLLGTEWSDVSIAPLVARGDTNVFPLPVESVARCPDLLLDGAPVLDLDAQLFRADDLPNAPILLGFESVP